MSKADIYFLIAVGVIMIGFVVALRRKAKRLYGAAVNTGRKPTPKKQLEIIDFAAVGVRTNRGINCFFAVAPSNLMVLSQIGTQNKIDSLVQVLKAIPELDILALDDTDTLAANQRYLEKRFREESNPAIKELLKQDMEQMEDNQLRTAANRLFCFRLVLPNKISEAAMLVQCNKVLKTLTDHGFVARLMNKKELKHMCGIYFGTSLQAETIEERAGENYFDD